MNYSAAMLSVNNKYRTSPGKSAYNCTLFMLLWQPSEWPDWINFDTTRASEIDIVPLESILEVIDDTKMKTE